MTEVMNYGPKLVAAQQIQKEKHRGPNESFHESKCRVAGTLCDDESHRQAIKEILLDQRFLEAGRVQATVGLEKDTTPYNCFVSGTIEDSMDSIMDRAKEAAETMRKGGGIGYDFSNIRPSGDRIVSLGSTASGPLSFMEIFDAVCNTIVSAGHRRGAQMGVLRVDHPDIELFIRAKQNEGKLKNFNLSVGITDEFMECVKADTSFDLKFEGKIYKTVRAVDLWDEIMRSTWDWAEPGVLFIDQLNRMNNLWYCEDIAATNPCAEQPLPPNGACLLGSFNLTKYVTRVILDDHGKTWRHEFDFEQFKHDIPHIVRMIDNVIDYATYPLPAQEHEAKSKRRMGLGITGLANTGEACAGSYGTKNFIEFTERVLTILRDTAYRTSVALAVEKGAFPEFTKDYLSSAFVLTLPEDIQEDIATHGIRNSHLLSIAPCGTISFCADNISSGIEPVFSHTTDRIIQTPEGPTTVRVSDYGHRVFGVEGATADSLSVADHLGVLTTTQRYIDSAVSKTLNVGDDVTFKEFKEIYMTAWQEGAKGCTTFRVSGKRFGIMHKVVDEPAETEGAACYYDPETGKKECE